MNRPASLDDPTRLDLLRRYQILDTAPEPEFDELAFLAGQLCQAPMALLGFFDAERFWIKAQCGLSLAAIPREYAWLALSGQVPEILVVPDALADRRFAQHPMVRLGPKARFYASVPLMAAGHLLGALEVLSPAPRDLAAAQAAGLQSLARQAVAQLELRRLRAEHAAATQRSAQVTRDLSVAYDATLERLARVIDLREREAEGHLQRVAGITVLLARALGVSEAELPHIRRGALLHDIGKLAIPDSVLLKPEALTEDEWRVMHQHPAYAYDMLAPIALLKTALDIPYCHHERWDGAGYPRGLRGADIPLAARIFSVVDVWDALRSDRPYRAGWPDDRVRDYIGKRAGADFDPQVVEAFLRLPLP
ncbi:MAG: HD domain-containing protein [Anaerolineales bacterium]|nr:HD domain-containing protein [Anaerolineales bacterium]